MKEEMPGSVCSRTPVMPSRAVFTREARPGTFACSKKPQSAGEVGNEQLNSTEPGLGGGTLAVTRIASRLMCSWSETILRMCVPAASCMPLRPTHW